MVEIADIRDKDSLEAWLKDQPQEVSVWIASRAAARVLPVWWHLVLTEGWAHEHDLTALLVLRSLLISSASTFRSTEVMKDAASAAADAVYRDTDGTGANAIGKARASARASANAAFGASARAGDAAYAATAANAAASQANIAAANAGAWQVIRADADQASGGMIPDALTLWPDGPGPLSSEWTRIKAQVADSPNAADWQFWLNWYDALLAGRSMLSDPKRTRDMLEQIATEITPETWDAGPETVNPKIREIWELYRLRAEVAALQAEKEAFLAARASHAQRSHNQPPEGLVDDQPEVARQITIIWDSLDEARDELEHDAPDKSRLRSIAERLLSALSWIRKHVGKVTAAGVLAMSVGFGEKVGSELAELLIENGRLMQFARDLLTFGGG